MRYYADHKDMGGKSELPDKPIKTLKLRQTLDRPVHGYWDGGAKQVFEWTIDEPFCPSVYSNPNLKITRSEHVRIGSFEANHYFTVKQGKTDKQTLSNAKRHLKASTQVPSTFEYIEE